MASNVNNENLIKFDIRIRVLKHSILLKLGLQLSNNREKKRQGTEKKRSKYGDFRIIEVGIMGSDL